MTGSTHADDNTGNVLMAVSLKYRSNFWKATEISLIHCKIKLMLNCRADCVTYDATREPKFAITGIKLTFHVW